MKYYIIAGEASGDLHASNLMKALKQKDAAAEFRVWGGDLMQAEGAELVKHYRDLAFMGFAEVLLNLRTIFSNIKFCKKDIRAYQPDAVILIDYPGFNLRIAEFVKSLGIKVFYYISPQIWAWKQKRVHQIKRVVDRMFVILPFEKDFYKKFDVEVDFVGHPLIDAIESRKHTEASQLKKELGLSELPIVAILPGSRKQEISVMLPLMLKMRIHFPAYQFVVAGAPSQEDEFYAQIMKDEKNVHLVKNRSYDLLSLATAALVTSGTATLETALFKVPEVVCYRGNLLSYYIARRLIKVSYISLVNLIMGREIVKELIQQDFNQNLLRKELGKLLEDQSYRKQMMANFDLLVGKLGGAGASGNTASKIIEQLKK